MTEAIVGAATQARPTNRKLRSWRKLTIWMVTILASLTTVATSAQAQWKTIFEDTFDGTELNLDTWFTRYIYNNGTLDTLRGEAQVYRDEDHHVVSDGTLKLVAKKEPEAG